MHLNLHINNVLALSFHFSNGDILPLHHYDVEAKEERILMVGRSETMLYKLNFISKINFNTCLELGYFQLVALGLI